MIHFPSSATKLLFIDVIYATICLICQLFDLRFILFYIYNLHLICYNNLFNYIQSFQVEHQWLQNRRSRRSRSPLRVRWWKNQCHRLPPPSPRKRLRQPLRSITPNLSLSLLNCLHPLP